MNYTKKILEDYANRKLIKQSQEPKLLKNMIKVPSILLSKKEVENLKEKKVTTSFSSVLNCNLYHIPERELPMILSADTGSANRSLALRIVAKALALRPKTIEGKLAMLSIAGSLASWSPTEADRCLRSI